MVLWPQLINILVFFLIFGYFYFKNLHIFDFWVFLVKIFQFLGKNNCQIFGFNVGIGQHFGIFVDFWVFQVKKFRNFVFWVFQVKIFQFFSQIFGFSVEIGPNHGFLVLQFNIFHFLGKKNRQKLFKCQNLYKFWFKSSKSFTFCSKIIIARSPTSSW